MREVRSGTYAERTGTAPEADAAHSADVQLLSRMLAGNQRAWLEFVRRFEPVFEAAVARTARRACRSVTSDDVDDILATVLCALTADGMRRLRTFDTTRGVRLSTWLGVVATNATWDYLRARTRHWRAVNWNAVGYQEVDDGTDPFTELSAKQYQGQACAVLANLSARDQLAVTLLYEDKTPEQMAEAMNVSVNTVYSKKHKIRRRLAQQLERWCDR
jgi:RNA polymerase sigma-70 factor (ECF subfamily)